MSPRIFALCSLLLYCALMGCLASGAPISAYVGLQPKRTTYLPLKDYNSTILEDSKGERLVSAGGRFELGFFTPSGASNNASRYLGIWYHKLQPRTVVWVANRDEPVPDSTGILAIRLDGVHLNFHLHDKSGKLYWSANIAEVGARIQPNYLEATLLDNGNLILLHNQSSFNLIIWQSFEYPADTWLPGMDLTPKPSLTLSTQINSSLNSWRDQGDPARGKFSLIEPVQHEFSIFLDDYVPYWNSGAHPELFNSTETDPWQDLISNNLTSNDTNWRLVMNSTGEIQYWRLDVKGWILSSWAPRDRCGVENACGIFGSCNANNKIPCKCLPGFTPNYQVKWDGGEFSGGCNRIKDIGGPNDTFLSLRNMKVGNIEPEGKVSGNGEQCRGKCLAHPQCQAYAYSGQTCWFWIHELKNLQEEYNGGASELFLRVTDSSIKPLARSCEPCGTDLIPYPLSTGPDCGESITYNWFRCDKSLGKTTFKTPTGVYNVTRIEQKTTTFFLQVTSADDCNNRNLGVISNLNQTLPKQQFKLVNVTYWCDIRKTNYGYGDSFAPMDELEIRWEPPQEPPTCNSLLDCKDWQNSNCKVSKDHQKRCICNTNFAWNSSALICTQDSGNNTPVPLIVGASVGGVVVVISCIILCCWLLRRKLTRRQEGRARFQNEALVYNTEKRIKELIDSQDFREEDGKGIDVHFFDYESILAATDNFSDANKLGQGGFGPVYKGKFPGGQEIAIKRMSTVCGQGLEEFKNEVILIARLQHRNLVRLLGYCLKGDEKILLYEYMPNKSLDLFLFDSEHSKLLTWEKRFDIIVGVARGLLYLHQDSRLRIVHRDLKTSNILLDEEMNPKISDFGLAKIVTGKQNEGSTERVIGTFGYMSPEYRLEGLFSVKSDVFSFGVVVLEILSGRKNTSYFNLLAYAWKLWNDDKTMELMEGILGESCNHNEFLKCVNVALLCIEEHPADRPTMSSVVVLLSNETETCPAPKKPACITRASQHSHEPSSSSSSKHEILSGLTMSEEGR